MYLIMVLWQLLLVEESGVSKLLSFDNSSIVSKFSKVSLSEISLETRFTKKTKIGIPFVTTPNITDVELAKSMIDCLGVGIIGGHQSIEKQISKVKSLYFYWHKTKNGYIHTMHKNTNLSKEIIRDLDDTINFMNKLPICAAVFISDDVIDRVAALSGNGCNVIYIDSPYGYHKLVGDTIEKIKKELSRVEVIAGSVDTKKAVRYLCEAGADAITIGVGSGYQYQKNSRTGYEISEISTIIDCNSIADSFDVPIIGHIDTTNIGDLCKGLGAGADSFIMDSYFQNVRESTKTINQTGKLTLQLNVDDILKSLKSSFMLTDSKNMKEFHSKVDFIKKY